MKKLIAFLKNQKVYSFIKENNALVVFLLTVLGTIISFVFKGMVYIYHAGRINMLKIPKNIIDYSVNYTGLMETIISTILIIISVSVTFIIISICHENIKEIKESGKKISVGSVVAVNLFSMFVSTVLIQSVLVINNVQSKLDFLLAIFISAFELLFLYIFYISICKKDLLIIFLLFAIIGIAFFQIIYIL